MIINKKCCGNCTYYMTDVDAAGNLSDFHHERGVADGFCLVQDLFYLVKSDDSACADWRYDNE